MEIRDLAVFFDGYLDAVSRQFSTDKSLIASSSRILDSEVCIADIVSTNEYKLIRSENEDADFEREISKFLGADSKERLVFYLVEYFEWFKHYSETFSCEKLFLSGVDSPKNYLGYLLTCNEQIKVLVYVYEKTKS